MSLNMYEDYVFNNDYDSIATCTKVHKFMWSDNNTPINYDPNQMPRSQDLPD